MERIAWSTHCAFPGTAWAHYTREKRGRKNRIPVWLFTNSKPRPGHSSHNDHVGGRQFYHLIPIEGCQRTTTSSRFVWWLVFLLITNNKLFTVVTRWCHKSTANLCRLSGPVYVNFSRYDIFFRPMNYVQHMAVKKTLPFDLLFVNIC